MGEPTRLADEIPTQYRELLAELGPTKGSKPFSSVHQRRNCGPLHNTVQLWLLIYRPPLRSDVLLITHEGCRSLELPGLSMSECSKQSIRCHDALKMHFSAFEAEGV